MTSYGINIRRYSPVIFMDSREPFSIRKVGVYVYTEPGRSLSFARRFDFANISADTTCVIEYAYYLDYDIQHLYDLEHIWIYLSDAGDITGAEGSFHGRFLNAMLEQTKFRGDHILMYSQPGKHAMMADPSLFWLYPEFLSACRRLSGIHGLDCPPQYRRNIHLTEEENRKVAAWIREHYAFTPSLSYEETDIRSDDYLAIEELESRISDYLQEQLSVILGK